MKTIITKPLSQGAKEIAKGTTVTHNNGIYNEKCDNITVEVKANPNKVKITYQKHILDELGDCKNINNNGVIWLYDEPEKGEVEITGDIETGEEEVAGTYVKLTDENLQLTALNNEINALVLKAIELVEKKEGYKV